MPHSWYRPLLLHTQRPNSQVGLHGPSKEVPAVAQDDPQNRDMRYNVLQHEILLQQCTASMKVAMAAAHEHVWNGRPCTSQVPSQATPPCIAPACGCTLAIHVSPRNYPFLHFDVLTSRAFATAP